MTRLFVAVIASWCVVFGSLVYAQIIGAPPPHPSGPVAAPTTLPLEDQSTATYAQIVYRLERLDEKHQALLLAFGDLRSAFLEQMNYANEAIRDDVRLLFPTCGPKEAKPAPGVKRK
jgi:hypothetical protein